ncbi:unnamed protein product [Parascedosporium putredinis]|uniref:Uncharacterized protein n=1 Tax=Parascedosporium putredinis TaxID=1442378 RepID=A0A9P1M9K6_9PEZI|nr:unnamed protein product [Parascedosporium putredinis]CAI7994993.1 unnamed protein product [Parascedosporium putredinis]
MQQPGQVAPGQPGQQMMFNPQQFAAMGGQAPFAPGGPNAGMMQGPGPGGMVQNPAMAQMGGGGQMPGFQQGAFMNAQYPAGHQQFNPNFMAAQGMPAGYQMTAAGLAAQQQQMLQQRMAAQQQAGGGMTPTGTPQRPMSASQNTPNPNMPTPPQPQTPQQEPAISYPQPGSQSHTPTAQGPNATISTPQTPTFPGGQGIGANAMQVPLSPQFTAVERERFSILLDINQELLYESMQLQHTQLELKKELTGPEGSSDAEKKRVEEVSQDFTQCLRRLNANLQYLAALADRKNKLPPCPVIISAPPLNMSLDIKYLPEGTDGAANTPADPVADRQDRNKYLQELYAKLQALFPGIDPKKNRLSPYRTRDRAVRNPARCSRRGRWAVKSDLAEIETWYLNRFLAMPSFIALFEPGHAAEVMPALSPSMKE